MESMPENLEALLRSLACDGIENDKNSKEIQHSSGQRMRLLLDAKRTEQGYRGADVSVGPSIREQAYVAAMLALKAEVMERERASKAILYFELMRTRRTDEEARDAVVQAMKELNLYKEEPLYTKDFGDHFKLTHVYELLRYFRPEFDDASEKERIQLLERTIGYVNSYLEALRRLTAFLQYGKPGAYEGLPTKSVTQAATQVKAAELRELMRTEQGVPLPYSKIGKLLGEKPTPGQAPRSYDARIKRMVKVGTAILKQGLDEQGYRDYIEAKRAELQHWRALREDEQRKIQMEENFGIYYHPDQSVVLDEMLSQSDKD